MRSIVHFANIKSKTPRLMISNKMIQNYVDKNTSTRQIYKRYIPIDITGIRLLYRITMALLSLYKLVIISYSSYWYLHKIQPSSIDLDREQ